MAMASLRIGIMDSPRCSCGNSYGFKLDSCSGLSDFRRLRGDVLLAPAGFFSPRWSTCLQKVGSSVTSFVSLVIACENIPTKLRLEVEVPAAPSNLRINRSLLSRRDLVLLSANLALTFASAPEHAYGASDLPSSVVSTVHEPSARSDNRVASLRPPVNDDVETWYSYRGQGFSIRVPPGYEDILDPFDDDSGTSLYGERAKEKPFAARFASPDREEYVSVVVRSASSMRLSFFETTDITDFGSIKDAASMFVPAGAKVVYARKVKSSASRVPRTYYMYEFLSKDKRVTMSAGVSGGRVFVLGAMAPQSKWMEAGTRLRLAASSFYLP